jgi:hypothetical protein
MAYMKPGSPFLYNNTTGDIVGVKDADGGETMFVTSTTNPDGSVSLVVGSTELERFPGRPTITKEWTRLAGPNDLIGWTMSPDISTNTAQSKVNEIFRREGAALKVTGGSMTQDYGNISKTALSWDLSAGGVVAMLVYVHNMNDTIASGSRPNLKLYLGTDYNNCRYAVFTNGDQQLMEGWNLLFIHTNEYNNFFSTQNPTNVTAWGARVASVDNPAPAVVGLGHNFATTPVSYCRLEFNNIHTQQTDVFLEGIYFGGAGPATLTIGFDIQGSNLDVYTKPAMDAAGFKGYLAVPIANADPANPTYDLITSERDRIKLYYDQGWDMIPHSASHNSLNSIEDAQRIADEYEASRDELRRLGCIRGTDMFVAPNNASDQRSIYELAKRGCRWQRASSRVFNLPTLVGQINPLLDGSLAGGGKTLAFLTNAIDSLIMYGGTASFFTHEVYGLLTGAGTDGNGTDYPSTSQMYRNTFEPFIAYVKTKVDAGLLRVFTPSQALNIVGETIPRNILTIPNSKTFTAGTSPWTYTNRTYTTVRLLVSGGTVSAIDFAMDGTNFTSTGQTAGIYLVQPGEAVKITYSSAPTVIQQRVGL